MKIEDVIKSTTELALGKKTYLNILYTQNLITEEFNEILKPFDLSPEQFNVLRILRGQNPSPATINLLKSRMLDKMSDTSRIVDRLVQKGLVVKESNAVDKRAVDIRISDKGLELLELMDQEVSLSELISSNLTEQDATTLNDLLDKMRG